MRISENVWNEFREGEKENHTETYRTFAKVWRRFFKYRLWYFCSSPIEPCSACIFGSKKLALLKFDGWLLPLDVAPVSVDGIDFVRPATEEMKKKKHEENKNNVKLHRNISCIKLQRNCGKLKWNGKITFGLFSIVFCARWRWIIRFRIWILVTTTFAATISTCCSLLLFALFSLLQLLLVCNSNRSMWVC